MIPLGDSAEWPCALNRGRDQLRSWFATHGIGGLVSPASRIWRAIPPAAVAQRRKPGCLHRWGGLLRCIADIASRPGPAGGRELPDSLGASCKAATARSRSLWSRLGLVRTGDILYALDRRHPLPLRTGPVPIERGALEQSPDARECRENQLIRAEAATIQYPPEVDYDIQDVRLCKRCPGRTDLAVEASAPEVARTESCGRRPSSLTASLYDRSPTRPRAPWPAQVLSRVVPEWPEICQEHQGHWRRASQDPS